MCVLKLVRILLILCLIHNSFASHANDTTIEWLPPHTNLRLRINLNSLQLEKENNRNGWEAIHPIEVSEIDKNTLINKPYLPDYFYLPNHIIRFAIQGTGLVYDYDQKTATLKRIDRTIHSGYNFSAKRFIRKDQLFSIGGEGFWSYNKHITYFDDRSSNEWELFRPKNNGPDHISDGFQGYSNKLDVFYSGGSNNKNFLEDETLEFTKDFQKFNFKTKSWEILGEISNKIPLANHRRIYWNGQHFVQLAGDRLYIIDPEKNEIYLYKDNGAYFESSGTHYVSNDTIKYYHFADRGPVSVIPVLALLKKSTYVGPFYEQDFTTYYLAGILAVFVGFISFTIYKKKRKIEPSFDDLERKLLNTLMHAGENYIPTNELNDILECSSKSQENQRRIRFMTIKQVNEKLAFYYNIKDAIERTPSTEDKRLINYRLKKGVREKIKAIL